MPGWINVPMRIETRNRLDELRQDNQSYDKIINELLDNLEGLLKRQKDSDES